MEWSQMGYLFALVDQRVFDLEEDTWRETSHNAPLIRLLLSDRVAGGLRQDKLSISLGYLGA